MNDHPFLMELNISRIKQTISNIEYEITVCMTFHLKAKRLWCISSLSNEIRVRLIVFKRT